MTCGESVDPSSFSIKRRGGHNLTGGKIVDRKIILKLAAGVGGVLAALPANAADDAATDEIIVSARKREESILKVPVIAAAITRDSLERFATDDLFAVASRIPGIQIGTSVNAVGTQLSMRGVGTTALNQTIDQSTSLNIDGLSLSQGLAFSAGMFDVGQVEVLKGPQALFFGKNSPAGVISLRSADPTDEFEAIARFGYEFNAKEKVGELIVSGPVSDSLKLRVAARISDMDGYYNNTAQVLPNLGSINPTDRSFPDARNYLIRGTALFEPGETYSARLKLNYTKTEEDGSAPALDIGFCPDGTGPVVGGTIAFIGGNDCVLDDNLALPWADPDAFPAARNNARMFFDVRQAFGTLEQDLKLGDALTVTSVTGLYENSMQTLGPASTTSTVAVIFQDNTFYNRQLTQEVRLASDFTDSPVNFMLGGFYQDGYMLNHIRVPANTALGLPPMFINVHHKVFIESVSVFGQVIWNVTDKVEVAAGARWTHEERDHEQFNYNALQGALGQSTLVAPHIQSSNVSPEFSITYTPTDNLTIFGSYKQGYKSGSFNTSTFTGPTTDDSFNDEKVSGGEGGIKSRMLGGALTVNLAGYYYHYEDLQVGALELQPQPGGGVTFALRTLNAATANVTGVEFDATYQPPTLDGLTLRGALNYNRGRYDSFPNAPCGNGQTAAAGCDQLLNTVTGRYTAQDLSGNRLVRAPEWSATFGFDYEKTVLGDKTLLFGTNTIYTSKYSTTLVDLPGFEQEGYAKIAANLALRGRDDKWELAVIGNNLTNKFISGWCINSNLQNATVLGGQISGGVTNGPAANDESACHVERGRELWLRVSAKL